MTGGALSGTGVALCLRQEHNVCDRMNTLSATGGALLSNNTVEDLIH